MLNLEEYLNLRDKYIEQRFLSLNESQRTAALKTQGPELILAGAGSGKTTVLINRIINLLKFGTAYGSLRYSDEFLCDSVIKELDNWKSSGYRSDIQLSTKTELAMAVDVPKPYNILAITFTNKAANELKNRIGKAVGDDLAKDIQASTFHSLCAKILRKEYKSTAFSSHFTIYDTDDSKRLLKDIIKYKFGSDEEISLNLDVQTALDYISKFKDELCTVEDIKERISLMDINSIEYKYMSLYDDYQKELKKADAMDFGDLIMQVVLLFNSNQDIKDKYSNRYKYILIDEYQDINKAQQYLIENLASSWLNICVVGDEDQSIYGFRGASVDYILNFPKVYPCVFKIKLEQNYRSTKNIIGLANSIIENNKNRFDKQLWTENKIGTKIAVSEHGSSDKEAEYIVEQIKSNGLSFKDTTILYRLNSQSSSIEQVFMKHKIPYRIVGGLRFFDRKEIKDILAYLYILDNPNDKTRLKRIINVPARKIGNTTIEKVEALANKENLSILEVCNNIDKFSSNYGLSRSKKALKDFYDLYKKLRFDVDKISLPDLIHYVYTQTGYDIYLDSMSGAEDRKLNINKLEELANSYENGHPNAKLSEFLEEISLISDADTYNNDSDAVTLMTIHSSKGLEFKNVFLIGWADGIFPSQRALSSDNIEYAIEEERRLAYVAITRAMEHLYITWSDYSYLWGQYKYYKPSRFISELNKQFIDISNIKSNINRENKENKENKSNCLTVGDKVMDRNNRIYTVESFINTGKCHIVNLKDSIGNITRIIWEYANMIIIK